VPEILRQFRSHAEHISPDVIRRHLLAEFGPMQDGTNDRFARVLQESFREVYDNFDRRQTELSSSLGMTVTPSVTVGGGLAEQSEASTPHKTEQSQHQIASADRSQISQDELLAGGLGLSSVEDWRRFVDDSDLPSEIQDIFR